MDVLQRDVYVVFLCAYFLCVFLIKMLKKILHLHEIKC